TKVPGGDAALRLVDLHRSKFAESTTRKCGRFFALDMIGRHLNVRSSCVPTRLHFVKTGASVSRRCADICDFPCEGTSIRATRVTENPQRKKLALCEGARSKRTYARFADLVHVADERNGWPLHEHPQRGLPHWRSTANV